MNASTKPPRGAIKAFREYLNAKHADGVKHKHGSYHQKKRGYGDYIYNQDRERFDVELAQALNGDPLFADFVFPAKAVRHA